VNSPKPIVFIDFGTGIPGAEIVVYSLPDDASLEKVFRRDGGHAWAVRRFSSVLNRQGEFEYEPMPSVRDKAFLSRCRFDTAEEAAAVYRDFLTRTEK
jgi:hypothetical protein